MSEPDFVASGEPLRASWANDVVSTLTGRNSIRRKKNIGGGGSVIASTPCPFGKLTSHDGKTFIIGGVVLAGDKVFNVPEKELNLNADSEVLVYFAIPCEVNMDDDNELLLPGVKTSSWGMNWANTAGDQYPDGVNPSIPGGIGIIVVPLGKLVIKNKSAVFTPTGCGNITIDHCGGTLTQKRG